MFKGFQYGQYGWNITANGKDLYVTDEAFKSSPSGFNWGYSGSEAFATAHCMLNHLFGRKVASQYANDFKFEVIAQLEYGKPFELPYKQVRQWLAAKRASESDPVDA